MAVTYSPQVSKAQSTDNQIFTLKAIALTFHFFTKKVLLNRKRFPLHKKKHLLPSHSNAKIITLMNTTTVYNIDIRNEAVATLKTVLLFNRSYGASYLVRILKGDDKFGLKMEEHKNLETYGELREMHFYRIENLIRYLIKTNYLQIKDLKYGSLAITDKGVSFLKSDETMEVDTKELRQDWYDVELSIRFKQIRKELSESTGKPLYFFLSNYTLQRLVEHKPTSISEIRNTPGCKQLSDEESAMFLEEIVAMQKKMERDQVDGTFRKVYSVQHRRAKAMHQAGKSYMEIAQTLDVKPSAAKEYLSNLHRAGELDLSSWIEEEVGQQELHRGIEYFKQAGSPHLKEAHEVLGMDYDKLHLCRAYVTRAEEEEVAYAVAS